MCYKGILDFVVTSADFSPIKVTNWKTDNRNKMLSSRAGYHITLFRRWRNTKIAGSDDYISLMLVTLFA